MKTKFSNAKILTEDMSIIDGGLCVKDNVIKCVFEGDSCDGKDDCKFDKEIDCKGNLLMPSFKNAHTHSAMTFLRSRADDMPLQKWLEEQVFPQEDKLNAEHIYQFTKLAVLEYLAGGITAAFDMYFEPEAIASAAKDTGFRITMCGAANNFGTTPQLMYDFYKKYKDSHELVSYQLGFHGEYTNSVDNLKQIAEFAAMEKAPVYTHMSETKKEHDECIERHGVSPAVLFSNMGLWEHGGGAFHCVHVSDEDIKAMAKHGIYAISNPASNLKLASGIAPLETIKQAGIKIALGTDGAASNNALSMFREMYFACTLQKLLKNDAAACPAFNALEWACSASAEAMGLNNVTCLKPEQKADIIMIDLNRPSMRPLNNIAKNIVYSGDTSVVKMTMINGVIRYMDGEFFVGEDAVKIIEKAEAMMKDFS